MSYSMGFFKIIHAYLPLINTGEATCHNLSTYLIGETEAFLEPIEKSADPKDRHSRYNPFN